MDWRGIHVRYISLIIFWAGMMVSLAYADGVYIPPSAVEILPEMPSQRGLLLWRDGVEQLLVESDFDGSGDSMAWIIPVPAEPTHLEVGPPGVFNSLSSMLQPKTVRGSRIILAVAMALVLWCACQWAINAYSPKKCLFCTVCCFILFYIALFWTPYYLMTLGDTPKIEAHSGKHIEVLNISHVGNYEVATLRAGESGALLHWLQENNFATLPEGGEEIVAAYIKEGWCFCVAKLQRDQEGYTRPHPLCITFSTEKPVYPMRLTRLAETDLFLDLYVIAEQRASMSDMETIYCDRFHKSDSNGFLMFSGESFNDYTTHPWLLDRMQDNDVLTHLRTEFPVEEMHQDIYLDQKRFSSKRLRLQTPTERLASRIGYALSALGLICSAGLTRWYRRKSQGKDGSRMAFLIIALPVAILVSFIPNAMSTVGQEVQQRYRHPNEKVNNVIRLLSDHPEGLAGLNRESIEQYVLECLSFYDDSVSFADTYIGDSPGRFQILEDERGIYLRTYALETYQPTLWTPVEYLLVDHDSNVSHNIVDGMISVRMMVTTQPKRICFGYVPAGGSKKSSLTILNSGHIKAEGTINARPPFYLSEESNVYSLEAGASEVIELEYRPEEWGVHRGHLVITDEDRYVLEIAGFTMPAIPTDKDIRMILGKDLDKDFSYWKSHSPYQQWAAIANYNDHPVDLHGWGITNDPAIPVKYQFPPESYIPPGDYIVIHFTAQTLPPGQGYATGFEREESSNGYAALTNRTGAVISVFPPSSQDNMHLQRYSRRGLFSPR